MIIIGVFVALAAQQWLQAREWQRKVDAAKQAMRRELLDDNGPQVYQRAAMHPCVVERLNLIRAAVEADRSRAEIRGLIEGFWVPFLTYDSLAHEAAIGSDVLSHVEQDELADFTYAYSMMPRMDRTNAQEALDLAQLRALSASGGPLSAAEAGQLLSAVEALRNHDRQLVGAAQWTLPTILKLGKLDARRTAYLMGRARQRYGDCVKDLPPKWPF